MLEIFVNRGYRSFELVTGLFETGLESEVHSITVRGEDTPLGYCEVQHGTSALEIANLAFKIAEDEIDARHKRGHAF